MRIRLSSSSPFTVFLFVVWSSGSLVLWCSGALVLWYSSPLSPLSVVDSLDSFIYYSIHNLSFIVPYRQDSNSTSVCAALPRHTQVEIGHPIYHFHHFHPLLYFSSASFFCFFQLTSLLSNLSPLFVFFSLSLFQPPSSFSLSASSVFSVSVSVSVAIIPTSSRSKG